MREKTVCSLSQCPNTNESEGSRFEGTGPIAILEPTETPERSLASLEIKQDVQNYSTNIEYKFSEMCIFLR